MATPLVALDRRAGGHDRLLHCAAQALIESLIGVSFGRSRMHREMNWLYAEMGRDFLGFPIVSKPMVIPDSHVGTESSLRSLVLSRRVRRSSRERQVIVSLATEATLPGF